MFFFSYAYAFMLGIKSSVGMVRNTLLPVLPVELFDLTYPSSKTSSKSILVSTILGLTGTLSQRQSSASDS